MLALEVRYPSEQMSNGAGDHDRGSWEQPRRLVSSQHPKYAQASVTRMSNVRTENRGHHRLTISLTSW